MITPPLRILCLIALIALQACASSISSNTGASTDRPGQTQVKPGRAPIPGGYWMYSFGAFQKPEDSVGIEITQSYYGIWAESRQTVIAHQTNRGWIVSSPSNMGMEWKLKHFLESEKTTLNKNFSTNNIIGIRNVSANIITVEGAAYNCGLPPLGDWMGNFPTTQPSRRQCHNNDCRTPISGHLTVTFFANLTNRNYRNMFSVKAKRLS